MRQRSRNTLIFVRESEGQLTGSDCCGKLEGDWRQEKGRPVFVQQREILQTIGPLAEAARRRFGSHLEILHVDPRNQLFLLPRLLAEAVHRRCFSFRFLRALLMLYRLPAAILNGELLFSGRMPGQEEFLAILQSHLEEQTISPAS